MSRCYGAEPVEPRFSTDRRLASVSALDERDVDPDPVRQLRVWYEGAVAAGVRQPDAMTLATATADGRVSARVVLLRGITDEGLVFYTSYHGRKARELEANPRA